MVHRSTHFAEPGDLLVTLECMWIHQNISALSTVMNISWGSNYLVKIGTLAMCLGYNVDMEIPALEGSDRLTIPYLLIDGMPCTLVCVGRQSTFRTMFHVMVRFEDTV